MQEPWKVPMIEDALKSVVKTFIVTSMEDESELRRIIDKLACRPRIDVSRFSPFLCLACLISLIATVLLSSHTLAFLAQPQTTNIKAIGPPSHECRGRVDTSWTGAEQLRRRRAKSFYLSTRPFASLTTCKIKRKSNCVRV